MFRAVMIGMLPQVVIVFLLIFIGGCVASSLPDGNANDGSPLTAVNLGPPCTLTPVGSPIFPPKFSFGVSTAAYQIEGGWNQDEKGPSIWDDFTHNHPDAIDDKSNGDVAADSYNLFDADLEALKELKVNHYRFSISWPRIFATGDISTINQKGIDYYNKIIDKLLENGIEPMVTMFHYDLPMEISMIGGFANPMLIDKFVVYADILYQNYGDRVKTWITFNEPFDYCVPGYGYGNYPPRIHLAGYADYLCMDHTLKAHAATYQVYKTKYFADQGGKVGITISSRFFFSQSNDTDVVNRGMDFNLGWLAHPIFSKSGGYPEVMVTDILANSLREGRIQSRLPEMDDEWKAMIKGSADFLGLNYYTSRYIRRAEKNVGQNPSWDWDFDCEAFVDPKWIRGKSAWLFCVPQGLEGILKYIRSEYDNVEVIITENGWSDGGDMDDDKRILYLMGHLQAVLNAINDGCNVTGYTFWSLIDNFEWQRGYTEKFGLYAVNFTSPNKERTAKKSAKYYKKVIKNRVIYQKPEKL